MTPTSWATRARPSSGDTAHRGPVGPFRRLLPLLNTPQAKVLAGTALLSALVVLGVLTRTSQVTRRDLRVDQVLHHWQSPAATAIAVALTSAAQEIVGLAALLIALLVLVLRRRRWDATRLLLMAGSSWLLAVLVKHAIDRSRPPSSLWLLTPDGSPSFPSGHTTTATITVVMVAMAAIGFRRLQVALVAVAAVFAILVGCSRLYLADHYPTDILGSYLTVAAATLLLWALTDLQVVRRAAARVLRTRELAVTGTP